MISPTLFNRSPSHSPLSKLQGRNELVETLSQWKQDDHVNRFFNNNVYAEPERRVRPLEDDSGRGKHSEFLARFWEGNYAKERPENYK